MKKLDFEKYALNSNYYSSNQKKTSPLPEEIKNILSKCQNKFKKVSILDIGCGDGNFLELIANNNNRIKLYASDVSKIRLSRTKQKLGKKLSKTFLDNICTTKINQKFEFINSDQVIEHVPSDKEMVQSIKKLLKKGGIFRISSVYKTKYSWYFYRCNGKWVLDPTHIREYENIEEFEKLFTDSGLKITKTRIDPICFSGIDFILRRLGIKEIGDKVKNIRTLVNKIKIKKPGYYSITVIGEKS